MPAGTATLRSTDWQPDKASVLAATAAMIIDFIRCFSNSLGVPCQLDSTGPDAVQRFAQRDATSWGASVRTTASSPARLTAHSTEAEPSSSDWVRPVQRAMTRRS